MDFDKLKEEFKNIFNLKGKKDLDIYIEELIKKNDE
jgi:hypothetical protein